MSTSYLCSYCRDTSVHYCLCNCIFLCEACSEGHLKSNTTHNTINIDQVNAMVYLEKSPDSNNERLSKNSPIVKQSIENTDSDIFYSSEAIGFPRIIIDNSEENSLEDCKIQKTTKAQYKLFSMTSPTEIQVISPANPSKITIKYEISKYIGNVIVFYNNLLFAFGGMDIYGKVSKYVFEINTKGKLKGLYKLKHKRCFHACLVNSNTVYIIGGIGLEKAAVRTIEKFDIYPDGDLPDDLRQYDRKSYCIGELFKPREFASACIFSNVIYISGGYTNTIEAFDIQTHDIQIIEMRANINQVKLITSFEGSLLVFDKAGVFILNTDSIVKVFCGDCWNQSQAWVTDSSVIFLKYDESKILEFNYKSRKFEDI
jgi:hypothetical protein